MLHLQNKHLILDFKYKILFNFLDQFNVLNEIITFKLLF
jgi:hypothetical protein